MRSIGPGHLLNWPFRTEEVPTKTIRCWLLVPTSLLFLTLLASAQIVYNPGTQWDSTDNPSLNGPWRYGWKSGVTGAFTIFDQATSGSADGLNDYGWRSSAIGTDPNISYNPNEVTYNPSGPTITEAHELTLHPGPSNQMATLRFTAPAGGEYTFAGTLSGNSYANGGANQTTTTAYLVQNTATFYTQAVTGYNSSYSFNEVRTLAAGDTVDVVVDWGYNSNYGADATGLFMTVTAVPEPSVYAVLAGLVALGFAAYRNRHPRKI